MVDMDKTVSLCGVAGLFFSRRDLWRNGFVLDYGRWECFKNSVKRAWWRDNVQNRADMQDAAIRCIAWKVSGHLDHFTDPMV
jgi:glycyl-tRNA synthetase (class II)